MIDASRTAFATVLLLSIHAVGASTVNITTRCHTIPPCNVAGTILLQSSQDKNSIRKIAVGSEPLSVTGQPGSEWDLTLSANGVWALPQRISFPTDATREYVLDVWRTGTIKGVVQLTPAPATVPPIRIVVASRPDPRTPPELPRGTSFDCVGASGGAWTCSLPATLLDIALRVEGYAPYHKWDIRIPAGGVVALGAVKLQKGASVVAWLEPEFAKRIDTPVRAELRYESAPGNSVAAMRLGLPVAEGLFSKKGVVQLAPIAPGRYVLEISAKGYAPLRVPVQAFEGRETTPRRSISLDPALRVRFRFEPAVGPGGLPWHVELWRKIDYGSGSQNAGGGLVRPDGIFEAGDQAAGPVSVYLKDARGNIIATKDITIAPYETDYTIRLDETAISGKLTLDDAPLSKASILFGGSSGAEKIRATTDIGGQFSVSLPRRGKWIVDVTASQAGVAATTEVTIAKDQNTVDIALPSTEVAGAVHDADGAPVAGAEVLLFTNGRPQRSLADATGNFRFRGISSGQATLRATDVHTHDYSKLVDIAIPEDGKVTGLDLQLDRVREVKGTLRSNGDVVVGALVHAYAFLGSSARMQQATSDIQGQFSLEIPSGATNTIIVVGAPGRTLDSFNVSPDQDPISLDLPAVGGTLNVKWTSGAKLRFTYNDALLPSTDVFAWARSQGATPSAGTAAIPNLAPGKYGFCSDDHCVTGLLAQGGHLDLDASQ